MGKDIKANIEQSSKGFRELVWPEIQTFVSGGRLVPVEEVTSKGFTKELDMMSGIDCWQIIDDQNRMRGLATRVQRLKERASFSTFTVRYARRSGCATEFSKRLDAIHDQGCWLRPIVFVQGYIWNDQAHTIVAAYMEDVIRFIAETPKGVKGGPTWYMEKTSPKYDNHDATDFAVVPVQNLHKQSKPVVWLERNKDGTMKVKLNTAPQKLTT